MKTSEFHEKLQRVVAWCASRRLDGVVLSRTDNFAWLGCGADSAINIASEKGCATLVVVNGQAWVVANNIELRRLEAEELAGVPVRCADPFDWWRPQDRDAIVRKLLAGADCAADDGVADLPPLPADFAALRYALTDPEIARYRGLGRDASDAIEHACRQSRRGMLEADIAALLAAECRRKGITPIVVLVAADRRLAAWRHPLAKDAPFDRIAMLVLCGRRHGLVAAVTRLVSCDAIAPELRAAHLAVCHVDAAMMAATRPGRQASEVFAAAQAAYARMGFADQWRLHHQGGAIGYQPRDYIANPDCHTLVQRGQAFAWNPSITGTKSEDTILVHDAGWDVLTHASENWPILQVEAAPGRVVPRPDILIV